MRQLFALIALPFIGAASAQSLPEPINLVCGGGGSANSSSLVIGQGMSSEGTTATMSGIQSQSVGFESEVKLWISADKGRITMPTRLLPYYVSRGNGWFEIKKLKITDDEITGSVSVSIIDHPKLRLNRITGSISLNGSAGDFTGTCQKYDPETAKRVF